MAVCRECVAVCRLRYLWKFVFALLCRQHVRFARVRVGGRGDRRSGEEVVLPMQRGPR